MAWNKAMCRWKLMFSIYVIVLSEPVWQNILTPLDKDVVSLSVVILRMLCALNFNTVMETVASLR